MGVGCITDEFYRIFSTLTLSYHPRIVSLYRIYDSSSNRLFLGQFHFPANSSYRSFFLFSSLLFSFFSSFLLFRSKPLHLKIVPRNRDRDRRTKSRIAKLALHEVSSILYRRSGIEDARRNVARYFYT